jgi:peptidoglycan/LPS O-acetylase OafA/YrhL
VATVGTVYLLWWGQGEQRGPVGWLLTNRWVTGLGACSYSLYLWHTQAQYFIEKDWLPVPEVVLVALAVVVTVALTALSFVLLERPLLTAHGRVLAPASATEPRPTRTSG